MTDHPQPLRRARKSTQTASAYRRKERLCEHAIWADNKKAGIRAEVYGQIRATLWSQLRCEAYLCDAVYRWLISTVESPHTVRSYLAAMSLWIRSNGRRSLDAQAKADTTEVQAWLLSMKDAGNAQRTCNQRMKVIQGWFSYLLDLELIDRHPVTRRLVRRWRFDHRRIVKGDGMRQALTRSEAEQVARWALNDASPTCGLSVLLQMAGGLRSAEVAALERRYLREQDDCHTLTIPGKGQRFRQIVVPPVIMMAIERHDHAERRQGHRGAILRPRGGGHYSPRQVQRWAKEAASAIGREDIISSHDLRRTFGTLHLASGRQLDEVQCMLGHSSIVTTNDYYIAWRRTAATDLGLGGAA